MAITDLASRHAGKTAPMWQTCLVCHHLENLPADEAAALKELLANTAVRYSELEKALADDPDYPLEIPALTLSRHARGKCSAREKLRAS